MCGTPYNGGLLIMLGKQHILDRLILLNQEPLTRYNVVLTVHNVDFGLPTPVEDVEGCDTAV